MKRRTFIREICLLSAAPMLLLPRARAQLTPAFLGASRKVAAAGGSCATSISNGTFATQTTFGGGNLYAGQANWQRPSAITICGLEFEVQNDGSSRNWFVAIYTQTGINLNLAGQMAVSAALPGANWASATFFGGEFTTPFSPSAATNYSLVIFPETALGGNDIYIGVDDTTTLSGGGNREVFTAAGAAGFASGNDVNIRILTQ